MAFSFNNGGQGQSIGGGASGITRGGIDTGTGRFITPVGGQGGSSRGGEGGGSSGQSNQPRLPTVEVRGNEVFIDGQGFSVAKGQMASFLASKGFGGSPNYA